MITKLVSRARAYRAQIFEVSLLLAVVPLIVHAVSLAHEVAMV